MAKQRVAGHKLPLSGKALRDAALFKTDSADLDAFGVDHDSEILKGVFHVSAIGRQTESRFDQAWNRVQEEQLEQVPFAMSADEDDIYFVPVLTDGPVLSAEEVAGMTEAEIRLFQDGGRAMAFGFVATHVTQLIQDGEHIPAGSTVEESVFLNVPGFDPV